MKGLLILILVLINFSAYSDQRMTDGERAEFLKEARIETEEFKSDNQGKFDLQLLKPFIYQALDDQKTEGNLTKPELVFIKSEIEKYSKDAANNNDEEKFFKAFEALLVEISKKPVEKAKELEICNQMQCVKDLKCAVDPKQDNKGKKCFVGKVECKVDSDCCSDSCIDNGKGKKFCDSIKRCFKPLSLGEKCNDNPICGVGACLPFDVGTIGIGECKREKNKCKENSDCCSNSCSEGVCSSNNVCKDCLKLGEKGDKKCCEGYYKNEAGFCTPDLPPIVPPQVNNTLIKKIIGLFIESSVAGEAYNQVNANSSALKNFVAKSTESEAVDFNSKKAGLGFNVKSNFETCDMHFREDFYAYLIKNNLFDQEVALLAFDYVMTGDPNNDYWRTSKGNEQTSVYGRLSKIANSHVAMRKKTNEKIAEVNRKLTCMCIDVIGVSKVSSEKADFFNSSCEDFKKDFKGDQNQASCNNLEQEKKSYNDSCGNGPAAGMTSTDCDKLKVAMENKTLTCASSPTEPNFIDDNKNGDASSVKAKRMLVFFTARMSEFNQVLTVDNTKVYQGIAGVKNWMQTDGYQKLTANEVRTYDFGEYTIDGSGGGDTVLWGLLLAAGVIAVLGGVVVTSSFISTWMAVGIITGAVAASGAGIWMLASLKGAWIAKRPEVADKFMRQNSCGKKGKATCTDWKRQLFQPYNNICNSHINANACVKNFLVFKENDDFRYVVDPFIPKGVGATLISAQPDHSKNLDKGYQNAYQAMRAKFRTGKVPASYKYEEFIDEIIVGKYAPNLSDDPQGLHFLNTNRVNSIKNSAMAYAVEQKFLEENDVENKQKFADYAYEFHFLWPKTTQKDEISYPTVGLETYLEYMSNGVAAKLSAGGANAALTFGGLNSKYLEDYLNTLQIYEQQANGLDQSQLAALKTEIAQTQQALSNNRTLSGLISSGTDLSNFNRDMLNSSGSSNSTSGASLSAGQEEFARAIGTYRKLRAEQVKKSEAYNKAVKNGEIGKDRAAKVSKALVSSSGRFTSGLRASLGSSTTGFGFGQGAGSQAASSAKDTVVDPTFNYKMPAIGSGVSGSSGYNSNGSKSSSSGSNYGTSAAGYEAGTATATDEDSKKLQDAISARDKVNSAKFQSNDENTLFEKVTNAYIRNYDKVLTKKKQEKDLIDKKDK